MKTALITGINGMDGSHLADFLLEKGYTVYGLERRSSGETRANILHIQDKIKFIKGDLTDQNSLLRALKESNPDEVYNLAAQSFVGESWNTPEHTSEVTGLGVLRMLEAIVGRVVPFD
jgi:GDPmannose 4,6-dehydratase